MMTFMSPPLTNNRPSKPSKSQLKQQAGVPEHSLFKPSEPIHLKRFIQQLKQQQDRSSDIPVKIHQPETAQQQSNQRTTPIPNYLDPSLFSGSSTSDHPSSTSARQLALYENSQKPKRVRKKAVFNDWNQDHLWPHKAVTDSNAVAQEKGVLLVSIYIRLAGRVGSRCRSDCITPLVEDSLATNARKGTREAAIKCLLGWAMSEADGDKAEGIVLTYQDDRSISAFRFRAINIKLILKALAQMFAHADTGVWEEVRHSSLPLPLAITLGEHHCAGCGLVIAASLGTTLIQNPGASNSNTTPSQRSIRPTQSPTPTPACQSSMTKLPTTPVVVDEEDWEDGRRADKTRKIVGSGAKALKEHISHNREVLVDTVWSSHAAAVGATVSTFNYVSPMLPSVPPYRPSITPLSDQPVQLSIEKAIGKLIGLDWSTGLVFGQAQNLARELMESPANRQKKDARSFIPNHLVSPGKAEQDRLWQMPFDDFYMHQIDSSNTDLCNTGGRTAGSCTEAIFLREFVDGLACNAKEGSDHHQLPLADQLAQVSSL
ncbi:Microtubule-associated protein, microtubule dynamics during spindle orientation [Puccinia graminis f. sp. tritici]|uniref:Microtubule-associated protein, microtubule dynamics during spindle orientation n=1 Tax=Puccinia graminis f. sp. tritici TaxID=56615 RepID=A0A5B0MHS4_PUCGR|nr:Microtubule-associated protein, microtubule dynamics during spindle orientation [Puccinia graminis f. sp. tritici]